MVLPVFFFTCCPQVTRVPSGPSGPEAASMDLEASLSLALGNLLSVPVLAFILGILAAVLRTDLRLPDPVYQAT
jgi:hypothetical protein